MTIRKLAGACDDADSYPGVWEDDQSPGDAIIVGMVLDPSPVPLGPGEIAVRVNKQLIRDANVEA